MAILFITHYLKDPWQCGNLCISLSIMKQRIGVKTPAPVSGPSAPWQICQVPPFSIIPLRIDIFTLIPRQCLATEKYLKMMKNAIHFTLKALFFLEIFLFLF